MSVIGKEYLSLGVAVTPRERGGANGGDRKLTIHDPEAARRGGGGGADSRFT
jgi:hypothetical protein